MSGLPARLKMVIEHAFIGNHRLRRLNLPQLRRDTLRSQTPTDRTEVTIMLALPIAITNRSYQFCA